MQMKYVVSLKANYFIFIFKNGGRGGSSSEPSEPPLDPPPWLGNCGYVTKVKLEYSIKAAHMGLASIYLNIHCSKYLKEHGVFC